MFPDNHDTKNGDSHICISDLRDDQRLSGMAYARNPRMDIVFLYTANESHNETYRNGRTPREIRAMETVAAYYGLPSVNFAQVVAQRLAGGEFDWLNDFGGVHPALFGNRIYATMIGELFGALEKQGKTKRKCPRALLDSDSLIHAHFLAPSTARYDENWTLGIPDWERLPGEKRARYTSLPTLFTETPGAELFLEFSGSAIGLFLTAGPDAGMVEYSIDGGRFRSADLYHFYSAGLHYPRTKMLAGTLSRGKHSLILRVSEKHNGKSSGSAVRIIAFAENSPEALQ